MTSNRIEIIHHDEDHEDYKQGVLAKLVLKDPVEFRPQHHNEKIVPHFKDEKDANHILKDVADVLDIYEGATVTIEGHTATADDKMDKWAQDLADKRAEHVKKHLVKLGVSARRLQTVGLPGRKGNGHSDTVFKFTSF